MARKTKKPRENMKSDAAPIKRVARGHFAPGVSGNPGGRPRDQRMFADLIRSLTNDGERQVRVAVAMMEGHEDSTPAVRLAAAQWLTERMIGKAPDKMELTGKDGGPVEVNDARERLAARIAALLASRSESGRAGESEPSGG